METSEEILRLECGRTARGTTNAGRQFRPIRQIAEFICLFLQNYLTSSRVDGISHSQPGLGKVSRLDTHQFSLGICIHEYLESIPTDHVMLSPQLGVVSLMLCFIRPKESDLGNIRITSADAPFRTLNELELHVYMGLPLTFSC